MGPAVPHAHVLLVDDTQAILDVMREVLQEEGYRVSVSLVPLEPARLVALAPDVIVQDLLFAGQSETGWSSLTLAQLHPELLRIPRILCTAASDRVREPAMAANLDTLGIRVLLKPFLLEDLLAAVSDALTAQWLIDQVRLGQDASASTGSS